MPVPMKNQRQVNDSIFQAIQVRRPLRDKRQAKPIMTFFRLKLSARMPPIRLPMQRDPKNMLLIPMPWSWLWFLFWGHSVNTVLSMVNMELTSGGLTWMWLASIWLLWLLSPWTCSGLLSAVSSVAFVWMAGVALTSDSLNTLSHATRGKAFGPLADLKEKYV